MARAQTTTTTTTTLPRAAPSLAFTAAESAALMRAGMRLFERWKLSDGEARVLLGAPSARTYARWKRGEAARVPADTARRLSYLMGIHKALRHVFKEPERAYAWIRREKAGWVTWRSWAERLKLRVSARLTKSSSHLVSIGRLCEGCDILVHRQPAVPPT